MKTSKHWLFAEQAAIYCFSFLLDVQVHPNTLRKFVVIIDAFLADDQASPRYREEWHILRALIAERLRS